MVKQGLALIYSMGDSCRLPLGVCWNFSQDEGFLNSAEELLQSCACKLVYQPWVASTWLKMDHHEFPQVLFSWSVFKFLNPLVHKG